jgi:hypothetical protein
MRKNYIIVLFVVLIFGLAAALLWKVTDTCETTVCQLASIMPRMAALQDEVSSGARVEAKAVPEGGEVGFGYVNEDGSILLVGRSRKLVVIARKVVAGSSVTWRCDAYPQAAGSQPLLVDCGARFRGTPLTPSRTAPVQK